MIKLEVLLLLLNQTKTNPKPSKLPDAEYIEMGIVPSLIVTKVLYRDSIHDENLKTSINGIYLIVTQTGSNPL